MRSNRREDFRREHRRLPARTPHARLLTAWRGGTDGVAGRPPTPAGLLPPETARTVSAGALSRNYCEIEQSPGLKTVYCGPITEIWVHTMPRNTKRVPRLQVTLGAEERELLAIIADSQKQSQSSIVAELVEMSLPALRVMVDALKVFKEQPREAQRLLQNYGNEAVQQLAQGALELDASITADGRTVKGKRARRAGGRATP